MSLQDLLDVPITVGSRSGERHLGQSLVPMDVITGDELRRSGYGELGKVLERFLPSFNFPRTALADGTDHARPFTLRGMGADQVLVLVNGKRRHVGALLHQNATIGRGTTGVDINFIPLSAIERIEVLRDGAAAQYGSDAIAGIINIILRQDTEEEAGVTLGETREGDGDLTRWTFGTGVQFEQQGFLNLHGEVRDRGATNRAGRDTRQQYFDGDPRNDESPRVTSMLGDAALDDVLLMANGQLRREQVEFYGNASFGQRDGDSTGFFRRPLDDRTVRAIYPDGYLPHITSDIQDLGLTLGVRSDTASPWRWDLSYTLGRNSFGFGVDHSLNASLGEESPTAFDAGELVSGQQLLGLDLFRALDLGLAHPLDLGMGLEWRYESFSINPGEPDSYRYGGIPVLDGPDAGSLTAAGAQVFPGFKPEDAVDASRHNVSAYVDMEYPFTDQWRGQVAARYEDYSDFGETLNGKLAASFTPDERWTWRGSVSTGFRAPSLAQSHYTSTATVFLDNTPMEVGTFSVDHPLARALGAKDLLPETSRQASVGFSLRPSTTTLLSLDYFYARVDDRIALSGDIYRNAELYGEPAVEALTQYGVAGARFFTNAFDTETQGIDLGLKSEWTLPVGQLSLGARYHYNDTQILGDIRTPEALRGSGSDVMLDRAERVQRIESGQPQDNILLTADWQYNRFAVALHLQRYGSYKLVNYLDAPEYDQTISPEWVTDLDLSYRPTKSLEVAIGAHNLFDVYPDASIGMADDPFIGAGKIIPYAPNAPFGYDGAFYYLRLNYRF